MLKRTLLLFLAIGVCAPALADRQIQAESAAGPASDLRGVLPVLYDQTGNTTTQGALAMYDLDGPATWAVQGADDFVVPAGVQWEVTALEALGFYSGLSNTPTVMNAYIYADAGGAPGAAVASFENLAYSTDTTGNLFVQLPSPVTLGEGTYWASVQPHMDFFNDGSWYWFMESVQTGAPFHWRNPGDGYGSGCTDWGDSATCGFAEPDLSFAVYGTQGVPVPALPVPVMGAWGKALMVLLFASLALVLVRRFS